MSMDNFIYTKIMKDDFDIIQQILEDEKYIKTLETYLHY